MQSQAEKLRERLSACLTLVQAKSRKGRREGEFESAGGGGKTSAAGYRALEAPKQQASGRNHGRPRPLFGQSLQACLHRARAFVHAPAKSMRASATHPCGGLSSNHRHICEIIRLQLDSPCFPPSQPHSTPSSTLRTLPLAGCRVIGDCNVARIMLPR